MGRGQLDNRAAELETQYCGRAWRERVSTFALEGVGAVEAESVDFDQSFSRGRDGIGGVWVDEEACSRTAFVFDVCMTFEKSDSSNPERRMLFDTNQRDVGMLSSSLDYLPLWEPHFAALRILAKSNS